MSSILQFEKEKEKKKTATAIGEPELPAIVTL